MKKKKIAIVLFILQGIALVGLLANGSFNTFTRGGALYALAHLAGFFLPTIIGFILLSTAKKEQASS